MAEFVNYRSFNDKAMAAELYEKLKQQGLPVKWEDTVGIFDASFANDEFMHLYYIKLRKEDFEKADKILLRSVSEGNERPVDDYYLFSFTDEELVDVLKKPGEWNEFDRYWAERILEERDVRINEAEIIQSRNHQLNELKKPWKLSKAWILGAVALLLFGYYFLYILAAMGCGFLGIYIAFGKKTVPNGEKVYAFSETNRLLGKIVAIAGGITTIVIILIMLGYISWDGYYIY